MNFCSPISIDQIPPDFQVKRSTEYGEELVLIIPNHIGCVWTKDNLLYRSSMWTSDGYLVSPSFPKFFNWTEKDNIVSPPDSLVGTTVVEKIDGSTLIVSEFKGNIIIRTRGTFNANIFENYDEIEQLKQRYPRAFSPKPGVSYLYEWYSPKNKIVLNYGDTPEIHLIGAIYHDSYRLCRQSSLDELAEYLGVSRPPTYRFEEIGTLLQTIADLKGKEGVCIYYDNDQHIKKVKAVSYLTLHAFKSELSINNLLDIYVDCACPPYLQFYSHIESSYDYECAEAARGSISILADAKKEVDAIIAYMKIFADSCRDLTRKDAAAKIIGAYGKTNRAGYVFSLLDNRPLDNEAITKLYHQVIPK